MEIKTIISSICLLLLAVSCSMDDDALRDIEKGHSGSVVIEEGEVALSMKVRVPATAEEISKKCGKSLERTEELLKEMSVIGLIEYNWENAKHEKQYILPMFVPGCAEFMVMNTKQVEEHPEIADFFEQMARLPLEKVTPMVPPGGAGIGMHVIPVEKAIPTEQKSASVEHIGSMELQGVPDDKMYYTLVPVYEKKSRLFTPVDNHKVVMRPVISKKEACDLIDHMQEMQVFEIQNEKNRDTVFKEALKTGDCEELVRVIKTIYEKKQERKAQGKKVTAGDERYFKLAEEHLYGELAIALGIEKDKVSSYIEKRIA